MSRAILLVIAILAACLAGEDASSGPETATLESALAAFQHKDLAEVRRQLGQLDSAAWMDPRGIAMQQAAAQAARPISPKLLVLARVGGAGNQYFSRVGIDAENAVTAEGEGFSLRFTVDKKKWSGVVSGDLNATMKDVPQRNCWPMDTYSFVDPRNGATVSWHSQQSGGDLQIPFLESSLGWKDWGWADGEIRKRGMSADTRIYAVWPQPGNRLAAQLWACGPASSAGRDPLNIDAYGLAGNAPGGVSTWVLYASLDAKSGKMLAARWFNMLSLRSTVDAWGRMYLMDSTTPIKLGEAGLAGFSVLSPDFAKSEVALRVGGMLPDEKGDEFFIAMARRDGLLALAGTTAAASMRQVAGVQPKPGGGQDALLAIIRLW